MNKNLMIVGVIALVLIIGLGFFVMHKKAETGSMKVTPTPTAEVMQMSPTAMPETSPATAGATEKFTVEGSNFKFAPTTLKVKKGDKVEITFKNAGGNHDFVIDEFAVKTKTIGNGEQEVVSFVADKTGTFDYYCSVGNHRAMGMQGVLTVE